MITDEMLSAAAEEVSAAMVASVPKQDHDFSPSFQRKMAALQRRAEHPVRYQILRQAAAVLVVAFMLFAVSYHSIPSAHAAVVSNWFRVIVGEYFQYSPSDTTPPCVEYEYYLPETFDGYTLTEEIGDDRSKLYVYTNKDGDLLFFEYLRSNDSSMFLDPENCIREKGTVGKYAADIYISKNPENSSTIVWIDTDTNILLSLSAVAPKEDLLAFAGKVEKFQKNKKFFK